MESNNIEASSAKRKEKGNEEGRGVLSHTFPRSKQSNNIEEIHEFECNSVSFEKGIAIQEETKDERTDIPSSSFRKRIGSQKGKKDETTVIPSSTSPKRTGSLKGTKEENTSLIIQERDDYIRRHDNNGHNNSNKHDNSGHDSILPVPSPNTVRRRSPITPNFDDDSSEHDRTPTSPNVYNPSSLNTVAPNDTSEHIVERLYNRMRSLEWTVKGFGILVLALASVVLVPVIMNASKDTDDELRGSEVPQTTIEMLLLMTSTATITTTTTAMPTTVKHWDWKTNCGVQPLKHAGRIVAAPWQVLVMELTHLGKDKMKIQNKCGGVLLNRKFVLTAANCLSESTARFWLGLGDYDYESNYESKSEVTFGVKNIVVHPNYVADKLDNDLALVELNVPVTFQEHILPICLPSQESDYAGSVATVAGWGSLRHASYHHQ